jgi:dUTP pyrophosphatase
LYLTNSVGVLDSGYRGEVMFKYKSPIQVVNPLVLWWNVFVLRKRNNVKNRVYVANCKEYEIGDRIGQLIVIPYPKVEFVESEDLSNSERGDGGYGSTGR